MTARGAAVAVAVAAVVGIAVAVAAVADNAVGVDVAVAVAVGVAVVDDLHLQQMISKSWKLYSTLGSMVPIGLYLHPDPLSICVPAATWERPTRSHCEYPRRRLGCCC